MFTNKSLTLDLKEEYLAFTPEYRKKLEQLEPDKQRLLTLQKAGLAPQNPNWLALLHTFRTYEWTKPYQPLDYSFRYMQQILYQFYMTLLHTNYRDYKKSIFARGMTQL